LRAIYALYADPDAAERAVSAIRAVGPELGIDARDIEVQSSEPLEEYEFGRPRTETVMPWLAALGGLLGGLSGFVLASWTQKAYPIPTGGMPIVTLWADGIITFELTMFGAILAALLTLLLSARLPSWRRKLHDPEISDGKILIGVVNPPGPALVELEKRMREAGADQVKEFTGDRYPPKT